ncbi:MAG: ABC transporter substrate-binding protein [Geminicoccaceae bacterium]
MRIRRIAVIALLLAALVTGGWCAAEAQDKQEFVLTYLGRNEPPVLHLSLAEPSLTDEGIMGARQAIRENQTTGKFLGQDFRLEEIVLPKDGDAVAAFKDALAKGQRLFVVDLRAPDLLAIAPLADEAGAIVFNSRATDDDLRTDKCFLSVFHTAPSRAMKADALAQYLVWKRWPNWVLIYGSHPEDQAMAEAYRHAAIKFGGKIVEERLYQDTGGARRTDSGHVQVQSQMPVFTQGLPDYDVMIVADESEVFGDYMEFRTWDARPVAGTSGLSPTAWSRVHEQWGGTQMQRRFEKFAGRPMTERDYNAWVAVRSLGEAATRTKSTDPKVLHDYLISDAFQLGAFKGDPVTYRRWDQQLREPILLVTPRMLVSVSPQEQFLHQRSRLDTLGYDEPESRCRLNP